jgi:flagellum-specific peptidoglycan hydrolase FlgJ
VVAQRPIIAKQGSDSDKAKFHDEHAGAAAACSRGGSNSLGLTSQRLQFLLRVTPPALESERWHEIPACVTIAQAILESATPQFGWGSSSLFRLANNPFGINYYHPATKPSAADCETVEFATQSSLPFPGQHVAATETYGAFDPATWEIENGRKHVGLAQFQRFPSLTEAFAAHAQLLRTPRYRPAYDVRHDWKQFAERLGPKSSPLDTEHCSYSTNPSYAAELINLIELYRLSDPRALQWFATGMDPGHGVVASQADPAAQRVASSSSP